MVERYVAGIQNGTDGLNTGSVVAVVKHWAGYGAARGGWDGHNYYGRYADFSGHNFPQHLIPFTGAFAAHAGSVLPTYSVLQGVVIDGKPLAQVVAEAADDRAQLADLAGAALGQLGARRQPAAR